MGIETATLALIAGGASAAATVYSAIESRNANKKISGERNAANAREQALERRQQVREARIRQAQILQSGENTGTAGSSGVMGAEMAVSTNLASNIAKNVGDIQTANNISIFQQDEANAQFIGDLGKTLASVVDTSKKKT